MPKRMHYTQDEWLLLGKAPVLVGMAVMGAGATSPLQMVRELIGIGQALRETSQTSGATALIAELNVETQAQLSELAQQPAGSIDLAQMRAQIPETCRKVTAIVDLKESTAAANEYKRWLLWIGRRVAAAATEDTSNPISADEADLMKVIATALGLENDLAVANHTAAAMQAPAETGAGAALPPEQAQTIGQAAGDVTNVESQGTTDATPASGEQP